MAFTKLCSVGKLPLFTKCILNVLHPPLHYFPKQRFVQSFSPLRQLTGSFSGYALQEPKLGNDHLEIRSGDQEMKFNFIWLRDHCRCTMCFNKNSMQRLIDPSDIEPSILPENVLIGNDQLDVIVTWSDGHKSSFPVKWLRKVYKISTQREEDTQRVFWDRATLLSSLPPDVTFQEYMESEEGVTRLLKNLHRFGIAFLNGVPKSRAMARVIGERVAPLKRSVFGESSVFEFDNGPSKTQELADHSFGSGDLPFHSDYASHEDPPGYCFMHFLQQAEQGGETFFSDALRAARILRESHPEHFTALSTLPVAFHKIEKGVFVRCVSTIFDVREPNQDPVIIRTSNDDRSVLTLSHTDAKRWYAAWRQFKQISEDPKSIYYLKGEPGRLVFFDNWRLMHGRQAFKGTRELEACNLSRDRVLSAMRTTAGIGLDVIV